MAAQEKTAWIKDRLLLYEALRLPRDATIQILSDSLVRRRTQEELEAKVRPFYGGEVPILPPGWSDLAFNLFCRYDVKDAAKTALEWARDDGFIELRRSGKLPEGLIKHFGG